MRKVRANEKERQKKATNIRKQSAYMCEKCPPSESAIRQMRHKPYSK